MGCFTPSRGKIMQTNRVVSGVKGQWAWQWVQLQYLLFQWHVKGQWAWQWVQLHHLLFQGHVKGQWAWQWVQLHHLLFQGHVKGQWVQLHHLLFQGHVKMQWAWQWVGNTISAYLKICIQTNRVLLWAAPFLAEKGAAGQTSIAIGNVELMRQCFYKHSRMETARMK